MTGETTINIDSAWGMFQVGDRLSLAGRWKKWKVSSIESPTSLTVIPFNIIDYALYYAKSAFRWTWEAIRI